MALPQEHEEATSHGSGEGDGEPFLRCRVRAVRIITILCTVIKPAVELCKNSWPCRFVVNTTLRENYSCVAMKSSGKTLAVIIILKFAISFLSMQRKKVQLVMTIVTRQEKPVVTVDRKVP